MALLCFLLGYPQHMNPPARFSGIRQRLSRAKKRTVDDPLQWTVETGATNGCSLLNNPHLCVDLINSRVEKADGGCGEHGGIGYGVGPLEVAGGRSARMRPSACFHTFGSHSIWV